MATSIDGKIVGYKVRTKTEPAARRTGQDPEVEQMNDAFQRPDMLKGATYKIKTPMSEHAMYVTINDAVLNPGTDHEQRRPFEVFINSKSMEHFQWVTALTRVISAVFRKGGDITFLVAELKQVFDPQGGYFKKGGRFMPSLVAEIGEAIESHMKTIGLLDTELLSSEHRELLQHQKRAHERRAVEADSGFPDGALLCRKCNTLAMVMLDNCLTCLNCGDSKCS